MQHAVISTIKPTLIHGKDWNDACVADVVESALRKIVLSSKDRKPMCTKIQ